MSGFAATTAAALLFAGTSFSSAAAQQIEAERPEQAPITAAMQAEGMPPPLADEPPAALLNEPDSNAAAANDSSENIDANIEMKLVRRGIYRCRDGNRPVFVDEENRSKYSQCTQIRAPYYEQVKESGGQSARASCSGAIVYKGSTYIFNDSEPCPIPEEIFEARKPIEANPEYYTQPTS